MPISPIERGKAKSRARPQPLTDAFKEEELAKCAASCLYFIVTYCQIYDNEVKGWIPFTLWQAQIEALQLMLTNPRALALKARQLGFTWLALAISLWRMRFQPISEILLFSQGEVEALELLSEQRMRGMYSHLPAWMQIGMGSADSKSEFRLSNGSGARALPPTRGGDSRTVTDLVIDEADLIENFSELLNRAEPTVGRSGNIILIGRAAKSTPNSPFKNMYRAGVAGENEYKCIFIPWSAHPERSQEWYEKAKRDFFARDGSYDGLYEQYPATDVEALQARSLDKRFAPEWIAKITEVRSPIPLPEGAPAIPGLKIFKAPEPGRKYGIGGDPAGGATDGDNAVANVIDAETYEQVAILAGKIEPTQFANYTADLAVYYNNAGTLGELNNHGNAYIAGLKARGVTQRNGITRTGDTGKPGWITTDRSKNMLYDTAAKVIQELFAESELSGQPIFPIIHDFETASEVASIDINTLRAPEGQHDDRAMGWVLSIMAVYRGVPSLEIGHHNLWRGSERPAPTFPMGTAHVAVSNMMQQPRAPEVDEETRRREIAENLRARGIRGGGRW